MILVYLSGPLTPAHDFTLKDNCDAALEVFYRLIANGVNCLSPHLGAEDTTRAWNIPYERWMAYDFALIDVSTHILMLNRWDTSPGAKRELEYAKLHNKIVCFHEKELYG